MKIMQSEGQAQQMAAGGAASDLYSMFVNQISRR